MFQLLSFVFMLVLALPLAAKSAFAETASTEAATGTLKRLSQPLQTLELKIVLAINYRC